MHAIGWIVTNWAVGVKSHGRYYEAVSLRQIIPQGRVQIARETSGHSRCRVVPTSRRPHDNPNERGIRALASQGIGGHPEFLGPLARDDAPWRLIPIENHRALRALDHDIAVDRDGRPRGINAHVISNFRSPSPPRQTKFRGVRLGGPIALRLVPGNKQAGRRVCGTFDIGLAHQSIGFERCNVEIDWVLAEYLPLAGRGRKTGDRWWLRRMLQASRGMNY